MLANTELGSLADSLKEGLTAFEKKCDELSAQQMTEAKYTAVSYTHLDVYKRQGIDIIDKKIFICAIYSFFGHNFVVK